MRPSGTVSEILTLDIRSAVLTLAAGNNPFLRSCPIAQQNIHSLRLFLPNVGVLVEVGDGVCIGSSPPCAVCTYYRTGSLSLFVRNWMLHKYRPIGLQRRWRSRTPVLEVLPSVQTTERLLIPKKYGAHRATRRSRA